ncbi:ABC transporter permease [Nocardia sp. NRRL S-836]|uniref:ABC transporter permease n=1 Tax=Nocardia sp. NRRL S-836 TaxID=1519492 RepID=UPI000A5E1162|nr:ABC transporter permease [Nocardia sp. NRRL S-836]
MTVILNEGDSAGTSGAASGSPVDAAPDPGKAMTRGRLVFVRFKRNKLALIGLAIIVLLYLMAFISPMFSQWSYTDRDYAAFLQPPYNDHIFGTDNIGTDMFAQVMRGLQKSLIIGMLVALISTTLAAVIGATAGYFMGVADRSLMWLVDLLLVLPSFLVIAILSPMFRGKSWWLLVFMLAAFQWMITARIVRGMTLTLKEREFVKAAKFMGQPARRIIAKHIVPNMASLLIIDATINVGSAVLAETGLSYFGFGVQSPDVSLGTLIGSASSSATTFPWLFLFPAGFLVVFVLAVNWVGDGLRDALDPTSTRVRKREAKDSKEKASR